MPHLEAVLVELKKERKRLEKAISDLERAIHYQCEEKTICLCPQADKSSSKGQDGEHGRRGNGWTERQHRPDKAVATQKGAC